MTKKQALNYLKSSGFSKEQIKAVVDALQEPTTKNLGVDAISRAEAQTQIEMNASRYTLAKERRGMGQVEWSDQLIKVSDAVNIIRNLPSVTPIRPKGHWMGDSYGYICSNCEHSLNDLAQSMDYISFSKPKYCPNCGADMREVVEDGKA